jgi:hypothetical protein
MERRQPSLLGPSRTSPCRRFQASSEQDAMIDFPDDIFTEPADVDPDTLANLGPLRPLAGVWEGRKGVDLNPKAEGPERRDYLERIEMQPIDPQANGPQLFYGLRYHVHIVASDEETTFHDQVGYWLWEPATGLIMQTLALPRGQVALARDRPRRRAPVSSFEPSGAGQATGSARPTSWNGLSGQTPTSSTCVSTPTAAGPTCRRPCSRSAAGARPSATSTATPCTRSPSLGPIPSRGSRRAPPPCRGARLHLDRRRSLEALFPPHFGEGGPEGVGWGSAQGVGGGEGPARPRRIKTCIRSKNPHLGRNAPLQLRQIPPSPPPSSAFLDERARRASRMSTRHRPPTCWTPVQARRPEAAVLSFTSTNSTRRRADRRDHPCHRGGDRGRGAAACPAEVRDAIAFAAKGASAAYHERQRPADLRFTDEAGRASSAGAGRRWRRWAIYVPGGRAAYPSTVLMNAVPAAAAGVERIAMVTPARAAAAGGAGRREGCRRH